MRSAIRDDNRPLLRLLLRAKGLTGIPDARKQGALDEADSDALFAATRCEESAFPWDRAAGPEQRAQPGGGRRAGAPGHRLPALQLQGGAAQRVDPRVRGVAERQPAARAAHPAAARAHADPLGRLRPAHAARGRRRRGRADPGRPARRRALHRPLGRRPATSATAPRTRSPPSSRASPRRSARTCKQVIAPSPIAPTRLSRLPGRTEALKTVAAVTATVRDVTPAVPGRRDRRRARRRRSAPRSAACAPGTRPRPRAATTCAASSSSPASWSTASSRAQPGTTTLTISGRSAPHGKLTYHPNGHVTGTLGGRKVSAPAARAAQAVSRPLPVKLPRYRRLLQLG